MKLFVIEEWVGDKWVPRYLQKGKFRWTLEQSQIIEGQYRVRRVKTPTERDQYFHLNLLDDITARTEWVN